jgi:hypothetical protein
MPNSQIELSYQVCPIILTGGIASQLQGGVLPMLSLLNRSTLGSSPASLAGSTAPSGPLFPFSMDHLDDAFGAFNVLPGGTLISQSIAKYPFANQWVAANAVIREPLTLSLIMDSPMRGTNAWAIKHMVFTSVQATLANHNNAGGTYTVATPAFQYDNLIMTAMTDNSRGNNSLPQNAWRFDFEKPLVAGGDLTTAQNGLTSALTNGTPTQGNISGLRPGQTSGDVTQNEGSAFGSSNVAPMQNIFSASGMMTSGGILSPAVNPNFVPIIPGQGPGSQFNGVS